MNSLARVLFAATLLLSSRGMAQTNDSVEPFLKSLAFRTDRIIADSTHPTIAWLQQTSVATYAPTGDVRLKLTLMSTSTTAVVVRDCGSYEIFVRDFVQHPYPVSASMMGVPDGAYQLCADLQDGGQSMIVLKQPIQLVEGIDERFAGIQRRLARINGHDSTKASINYPFDLARVINVGRKNLNAFDLGLNTSNQPNYYDFAQGMKRSEALLDSLEAGKDPLWKSMGDNERHYWFADAGEIMPYRMYVPTNWDGRTMLPMILILHGNTRDQDFYMERDNRIIPKLAQKGGYLLVMPFAYHPNGGYNAGMIAREGAQASRATVGGNGRGGRGGGEQHANGMPNSRVGELSEADAWNVFNLVKAEYPIDPKRTFLFGYSAGGTGSYYFGEKYATNWAAVALGGSNLGPTNYPFDRVKEIPFQIFFGSLDAGTIQPSRNMAAAMKEHGMEVELIQYEGANHDTAPGVAVTHVFEFFDTHPKK